MGSSEILWNFAFFVKFQKLPKFSSSGMATAWKLSPEHPRVGGNRHPHHQLLFRRFLRAYRSVMQNCKIPKFEISQLAKYQKLEGGGKSAMKLLSAHPGEPQELSSWIMCASDSVHECNRIDAKQTCSNTAFCKIPNNSPQVRALWHSITLVHSWVFVLGTSTKATKLADTNLRRK